MKLWIGEYKDCVFDDGVLLGVFTNEDELYRFLNKIFDPVTKEYIDNNNIIIKELNSNTTCNKDFIDNYIRIKVLQEIKYKLYPKTET